MKAFGAFDPRRTAEGRDGVERLGGSMNLFLGPVLGPSSRSGR
jgi:hypothetical protein